MPLTKILTRPLNADDACFVLGISRNTLKKYAKMFDIKAEEHEGRRLYCPVKIERLEAFLNVKKNSYSKRSYITKK